MKQIQFQRAGTPVDVVECVEVAEPKISAPDDVLVNIDAFPINPADLLTLQGFYPRTDPSSPVPGVEAVGTIEDVGRAAEGLTPGDRVIVLSNDNWTQKKTVKARDVIRVSSKLDRYRLGTLKVNPATAALLLERFVALSPGDWVLQNAANSAVGSAFIQIAKSRGLRTVNVVRRKEVASELERIGADVVIVDGDDLAARVRAATSDAAIRLATDAVAGPATGHVASCVAQDGVVVVYGAMSGEACSLSPLDPVFRGVTLRGFWLTSYLATASREEKTRLYGRLETLALEGTLTTKVDSVHPPEDIKKAVARAQDIGGEGKVFVSFGGDDGAGVSLS